MTDIRDTIREKLLTLGKPVFYGTAEKRNSWDYIVFRRSRNSGLKDKRTKTEYFTVFACAENYLDVDIDDKIKSVMLEIPGMRVCDDAEFDYTKKNGTDLNIEFVGLTFYRAVSKL